MHGYLLSRGNPEYYLKSITGNWMEVIEKRRHVTKQWKYDCDSKLFFECLCPIMGIFDENDFEVHPNDIYDNKKDIIYNKTDSNVITFTITQVDRHRVYDIFNGSRKSETGYTMFQVKLFVDDIVLSDNDIRIRGDTIKYNIYNGIIHEKDSN